MPPLTLPSVGDAAEIRQDIQELFEELSATLPADQRAGAGQCQPAVDVVEDERAVHVYMDVAGISPQALRVLFRGEVLVVVGEKASPRTSGPRSFHLVEREFGRFARAIRLTGAFDVSAARAELREGELHLVIPRRAERRGTAHRIPVTVKGDVVG